MKNTSSFLKVLPFLAILIMLAEPAFGWGKKGHDITCEIAQRHLTARAKKKITKVLDGKSIVYWANWMDNASHSPEYAYTKTWHYKNIDADETFESAPVHPKGDVVTAINAQVQALRSGSLSHEEEALALVMLVHLVGDLHCPMHMGHRSDSGGNKWQVRYFNSGKNLHSVWDSDLLEGAHKWSYSEWADNVDILGRKEVLKTVSGSVEEWGAETAAIARDVYERTPAGTNIAYDEIATWAPTIETQVLRGGLRLAAILNSIY